MTYKVKGFITKIGEVKTTCKGTAVQQIHFQDMDGHILFPSALGKKTQSLTGFLPGDPAELEFYICGSKGAYNNVVINNLTLNL